MNSKLGRNAKCFCGSEKKYKNCCLKNSSERKLFSDDFHYKLSRGEVPFVAQIISNEKGASGSMGVKKAEIIDAYGNKSTLMNDEVVLSINDTSPNSSAMLQIYPNTGKGVISITGAGTVTNSTSPYRIKLPEGKKRIKVEFEKFKAIIKYAKDRDTDYEHLHILFVYKDNGEFHTDARYHFDGNSKFIRLGEFEGSLQSKLDYAPTDKLISPNMLSIDFAKVQIRLEVKFEVQKESKIVLITNAELIKYEK